MQPTKELIDELYRERVEKGPADVAGATGLRVGLQLFGLTSQTHGRWDSRPDFPTPMTNGFK